jgi:hypothetical protein
VTIGHHRFGGAEYRLCGQEIGHVHGCGLVDIPLNKTLRDRLVAAGNARPHHIYPNSSWISFQIASEADLPRALALLHLGYERRRALRRL